MIQNSGTGIWYTDDIQDAIDNFIQPVDVTYDSRYHKINKFDDDTFIRHIYVSNELNAHKLINEFNRIGHNMVTNPNVVWSYYIISILPIVSCGTPEKTCYE